MQRDGLDFLTWTAVAFMVIPFALFMFPQVLTFSDSHIVRSDSTGANISSGSVIFTSAINPSEISEGDIVTFMEGEGQNEILVPHKVSEIRSFDQETQFKTGSIDPDTESKWVADYQVEGKVGFVVPIMGRIVGITEMAVGRIFVIVAPAILLMLNELRKIVETVDSNETDLFGRIKG